MFNVIPGQDTPWFVKHDRAFFVEECGGCWVKLVRGIWWPEVNEFIEESDVSFYGPVQAFA